jgi:hypothetical protein
MKKTVLICITIPATENIEYKEERRIGEIQKGIW